MFGIVPVPPLPLPLHLPPNVSPSPAHPLPECFEDEWNDSYLPLETAFGSPAQCRYVDDVCAALLITMCSKVGLLLRGVLRVSVRVLLRESTGVRVDVAPAEAIAHRHRKPPSTQAWCSFFSLLSFCPDLALLIPHLFFFPPHPSPPLFPLLPLVNSYLPSYLTPPLSVVTNVVRHIGWPEKPGAFL